jgi:hypothetical protein
MKTLLQSLRLALGFPASDAAGSHMHLLITIFDWRMILAFAFLLIVIRAIIKN